MTVKFHPDDSTLMSYAAGTLDEAFAVVVSCHLETCTECRNTLNALEMIGGAALESANTVSIDEGAFGRVLEKISAGSTAVKDSGEVEIERAKHSDINWNEMPNALRQYLSQNISDVKWSRMGPGVWQHKIALSKGAKSSLRLLKIAPGKNVPEHGHSGQEMTIIMQGAYQDEIGHFGVGDVADLDEDIEHQPHVVSQKACICLAATEAPTKFKNIAGRIMQPFFGI